MAETYEQWLEEGIAKKWCGEPTCAGHDTMWSEDEWAAAGDGEDLLDACLFAVRLLPEDTQAEGWRAERRASQGSSQDSFPV